MRRRDIPVGLLAAAGAGYVMPIASQQAAGGGAPYAATPEELKSGAVALHPEYPPGNVRRYGAGDGRGRDEVAFHAACAANNQVYVPGGDYLLNSQVNVDRSHITIVGENPVLGAANIRLAAKAGRGAAAFRWNDWATDVQVANLGFFLKNSGAAQLGLRFAQLRRARITNCYIEGVGAKGNDTSAIQFDGPGIFTGDVNVESCYLTAHRIGVDLQGVCTTVRVLHNEMYGISHEPGSVAIRMSNHCVGVLVAGNSIEGWETGVYCEGGYLKQIGNYFEDNSTHWRWVRGAGNKRIWNSSFGDIFLSGGPPVYPRNDIDSCVVFGQSGNFVDTGFIEASRGFRERLRNFNLGEWVSPAFSSERFYGSGGMRWTVRPGDVQTFAYTLVGKTMTLSWLISGSQLSGPADRLLHIAVPDGYIPNQRVKVPVIISSAGQSLSGCAEVNPERAEVRLAANAEATASFAAGALEVSGQIVFEVR
jgi:Pectate lyase superfamily protein